MQCLATLTVNKDTYNILYLEYTECLNSPYYINLIINWPYQQAIKHLLGQQVSVTITNNGHNKNITGIISYITTTQALDNSWQIKITVHATWYHLYLNYGLQVYYNTTISAVIAQIFAKHNLSCQVTTTNETIYSHLWQFPRESEGEFIERLLAWGNFYCYAQGNNIILSNTTLAQAKKNKAHTYCYDLEISNKRLGAKTTQFNLQLAYNYTILDNDYFITTITHYLQAKPSDLAHANKDLYYYNQITARTGEEFYLSKANNYNYPPYLLGKIVSNSNYSNLNHAGWYQVEILGAQNKNTEFAWLPKLQPYLEASTLAGLHFPLYKDTRVIIGFLDGNSTKPVIMGALPTKIAPSPVTSYNAKQHLVMTAGGNKICLDDSANTALTLATNKSQQRLVLRAKPEPYLSLYSTTGTIEINCAQLKYYGKNYYQEIINSSNIIVARDCTIKLKKICTIKASTTLQLRASELLRLSSKEFSLDTKQLIINSPSISLLASTSNYWQLSNIKIAAQVSIELNFTANLQLISNNSGLEIDQQGNLQVVARTINLQVESTELHCDLSDTVAKNPPTIAPTPISKEPPSPSTPCLIQKVKLMEHD